MKNPTELITVVEAIEYQLPTYFVTEEGLQDGAGLTIKFCKGNKADASAFRQEGVLTESLIEAARKFILSVNKGDLFDKHNEMTIAHLDAALASIKARADERKARGVQGTYKP